MNVIIKNKSTGHQQTVTKEAWENGKQWFVGYHLVMDEPELLTGEPEKKKAKPKPTGVDSKTFEEMFENAAKEDAPETETPFGLTKEIKPKIKRKKKDENDND